MKSYKIKIALLSLTILGITMIIFPQKVSAAYPTFKNDWTWNYNGAAYYYNVSLSSSYATAAKDAAANWYKTGYHTNPLYPMTKTNVQTNSPIDLYKTNLGDNINGRTDFFVSGGAEVRVDSNGPVKDWLYCKILINETFFNKKYSTNSAKKKALILHEMGHVFGLKHTSSTATIMYPYMSKCTVTKVTRDDSAALVQKLKF